ncbi:MAG: cytochrome c3 family protein, partial [Coriobacteriales bacterium]|nr:cytochrome c3 family protein [Coriobacteriales bacterium]
MKPHSQKRFKLVLWLVAVGAVLASLIIAGCAPRQTNEDSPQDETDSLIVVEWSMDSDCATCHTAESTAQDPTAPALYHEEQEGVACVTCHTADESELATVHEGVVATGTMPTRLKKTKVTDEACLSCHDTAELVTVTQASTVLTDDEGLVVNPHDLPENSSHVNLTCTNCHKQHQPKAEIAKNAMATCTNCHHE